MDETHSKARKRPEENRAAERNVAKHCCFDRFAEAPAYGHTSRQQRQRKRDYAAIGVNKHLQVPTQEPHQGRQDAA